MYWLYLISKLLYHMLHSYSDRLRILEMGWGLGLTVVRELMEEKAARHIQQKGVENGEVCYRLTVVG